MITAVLSRNINSVQGGNTQEKLLITFSIIIIITILCVHVCVYQSERKHIKQQETQKDNTLYGTKCIFLCHHKGFEQVCSENI